MLGTPIIITIIRNTDEVDSKGEYIKETIYSLLPAKMIEVGTTPFTTNMSQADPVQKFTFYIEKDKTLVKIGDNIIYQDQFGEVTLKVVVRPKMIEFEESESFIKLTAELIGV